MSVVTGSPARSFKERYNMTAKRDDEARGWKEHALPYGQEWTEDWNRMTLSPPTEYELLRECCRRLRHIRAAVWTIAGVILAGLAIGWLGLLVSRH
jgi:hypothetical protein